jgi:hypothetical protein
MHAALRDHEPVAWRLCDELELRTMVDLERLEVACVDPDHGRVELHRALKLVGVVSLDECIHAELRRVREQVCGRRVVEIAQDEQYGVGTCLAQLAQVFLGREEALPEERSVSRSACGA